MMCIPPLLLIQRRARNSLTLRTHPRYLHLQVERLGQKKRRAALTPGTRARGLFLHNDPSDQMTRCRICGVASGEPVFGATRPKRVASTYIPQKVHDLQLTSFLCGDTGYRRWYRSWYRQRAALCLFFRPSQASHRIFFFLFLFFSTVPLCGQSRGL